MYVINLEILQNLCVVRDDEKRIVVVFVAADALRHDLYGVHVETGIRFVQHCKLRLHNEHLEDFRFFLFTAGEADIQIALRIGLIHVQRLHDALQLLLKSKELERRPARDGAFAHTEKVLQRDARNLLGRLEREEDAASCASVGCKSCDVLFFKENGAGGDLIFRVSHDDIVKRRFARAVRTHENVGLALSDREIQAGQDFFSVNACVQILHLQ